MSNGTPAKNPNTVFIDARAAGFDGEPVRVMAVMLSDSGKIRIIKSMPWIDQPIAKDNTIVVTDTPAVFKHWGKRFNEREQMQEVLAAYKATTAANLVVMDAEIARYDPKNVVQTRKVDEGGRRMDFDSMSMNNGHVAILLIIWTARLVHGGYVINDQSGDEPDEDDDADNDMMPFSI